jgi:hypothetical protein
MIERRVAALILDHMTYFPVADIKPANQYVIVPAGASWKVNEQLIVCSLETFLKEELAKCL